MAKNKINFEIGFTTNLKNLNQMKSELAEIRKLTQSTSFSLPADQVGNVLKSANNLEHAMTAAFNPKLNTVNVQKFNNILKQSGTNLAEIQKNFSTLGAVGNKAFAQGVSNLMSFNNAAKQTNEFLENIGTSIGNTIRWSLISSAINTISGGIQQSYYYIKDLDSALNDIRIVTGKSADEMSKFAEEANNAAKSLAVTTEDYTQGSLIYYQQGLDDETVKALTEITAKTSNVTGQSMGAVSEELTAVWNGYKVANEAAKEGMQVYEEYVDKMAAVGASTASDLQELSTAMSKVASAASAMGVDFDDLNAQIATIVSVTRQAPESVGTALKTIYARLGDLKVDGVDEFGVKLGEITGQLQTMGIQILDSNGDMRNMSDVMAEVAEKWNTWTSAQRQAAAVAMAGKRQYNNLVALFDNWDMYGEALQTSMEAAGTLEEQQEIALDSLSNKMDQLKATAEDLYDSLYDEEDIKNLIEGITHVVQGLADFSDSIGGLVTLLPMLGSTAMRVFSNQIANGLNTIIVNTQNAIAGQKEMQANYANLQLEFPKIDLSGPGKEIEDLKQFYDTMYQYRNVLSSTEQEQYNAIKQSKVEIIGLNGDLQESLDLLQSMNKNWELIDNSIIKSNDSIKDNVIELTKQLNSINSFSAKLKAALENGVNNNDTALNIVQKLGLDKLDPRLFDNVKTQIESLNNESKDTEEILTIILNKFQEIGKKGSEVNNATNEVNRLTNASKNAEIELERIAKQKFDISNIVNITGAFGQLATSINTIKNLGSIWSNKDIEVGDKILQTMMNISFASAGLIGFFTKFNEIIPLTTRSILNQVDAQVLENLELEKNTILKEINTAKTKKDTAEKYKHTMETKLATKAIKGETISSQELGFVKGRNTIIEQQENIITEKQILLENKEALTKAYQTLQSKGFSIAKTKEIAKILLGTSAINADTSATALNTVAKIKNAAVIGVAAVGITALIATIAVLNKARQKELEQISESNEKDIEEIKAKQELINTNTKLVDSYNQIYNQYKKNKDVKNELYDKTLELVDAYEIEDGKILALGDHYVELAAKIKKAREEELTQGIEEAQDASQKVAERAAAEADNGGIFHNSRSGTYDPSSGRYRFKSEGDPLRTSKAALEAAGLPFNEYKGQQGLTYGYEIDIDVNTKDPAAMKETIKQLQAYADYQKAIGAYNEKDPIIEEYNQLKEFLPDINEQLEKEYELRTRLAVSRSNIENVSTLKQYYEQVKDIRAELDNTSMTDEEIDEQLQKILKNVNSVANGFDKIKLAERMKDVDSSNKDIEDYVEEISKLNDSELSTITLYLDTSIADEEFNKWLEKHGLLQETEGAVQRKKDVTVFLSAYAQSGKISQEDIDTINQNENTKNNLNDIWNNNIYKIGQGPGGSNSADFANGTEWEQASAGVFALIEAEKEYVKNAPQVKAALEEERKEFSNSKEYQDAKNNYEELEKEIENITAEGENANKVLAGNKDELLEALRLWGEDEEKLSGAQKALIDEYLKVSKIEENELVIKSKQIENYDKAQNALDAYTAKIEEYSNAKYNTIEIDQKISDNLKQFNEDLDKLQSSYKSLIDIMSNYNETGHFTIDNIQTLIGMDASLAASLDIQNGKLEISEDAYKRQALAILESMKATALSTYQNDLEKIAAAETAGALYEYTAAAKIAATGASEMTKEVKSSTEALKAEADAIREKWLAQSGLSQAQRDAEAVAYKAYTNKITAIDDTQQEIIKGGYNFRRAMGTQTQADKDKDKQLKKTDKEKKREEDEINRYWEIEKALEKIADALKKVDKLKSHVFGKQKIQVLQQEATLIKQQTQLYEKLYEEQKKEAEELKAKLSAGGTIFSAEGEVLNYGAALKGALATYNKAVDDFNAGLIDDQAFKIAEDNYQKFKKDMDRYDKLFYSEMKDTREKIEEEAQKLRDIALEEFEIKIQVKIDKAQLRRDFRNFRKELQKDFTLEYEVLPKTKDFRQNFKDDKSQVNTYMQEAQIIQKEIDTIMAGGSSKMFASLSEAQEKLKKVNQDFQDASKRTMQDVEDAWDNYIAKIDQANKRIEDQEKRLERVNTQLESFRQIAELAFGSKAYEQFGRIFEQQLYNNQAQIEIAMKETETYQKLFEKQIEIEGANRNNMSTWSEAATAYYNQWKDKEQEINDLTAERLKLLKDDYLNTLDQINDSLEKQLTTITTLDENGHEITISVGFDIAEQEWELAEKQADLFYNSTEKAYQMQSLSNKIQQDIDKSSLASQKKLQAFRDEQLSAMNKEDVLTKDQVAAAQAKYDILLKQIALEEARNNKTSMKLTRNAEGNWSYQYVADDSDVQQKQQDLLDSWEKLRSLSQDQMNEAAKNLQTYQKMANDAAVENEKKFAEGLISKEQYEYTKQMIEERYYKEPTGILYVLGKNYQESKNNLILGEIGVRQEVYDQDKDHYIKFTEEEKAILDDFREHTKGDFLEIEKAVKENYGNIQTETEKRMDEQGSTYVLWNTATTKMADAWTNDKTGVKAKITKALKDMEKATSDYKKEVEKTVTQVGLDWESMKSKIEGTKTETDLAKKAVIDYCKTISRQLPKAAQQVQNLMTAWERVKDKISDASIEIEEYLKKQQDISTPSAPDNLGSSPYGGGDTNSYGNGGSGKIGDKPGGELPGDSIKKGGTTNTIVDVYASKGYNKYGEPVWKFIPISSSGVTQSYASEIAMIGDWSATKTTQEIKKLWLSRYGGRPVSYDTGGYTGSWGNEGRLATLHQKELVLNAKDTENFLEATDSLRKLTSLDASIEKSIANAISKMLINMATVNNGANGIATSNNESNTNNIFNINAEFPNANDVNEIREAILSLPSLASQYIHRTGY